MVATRSGTSARLSAVLVALGLLVGAALVVPGRDAEAATSPALYLSLRPDRSSATLLGGTTVRGPIYVFVARSPSATDTKGIKRVDFAVDGIGVRVEELAPFDLAGSGTTGANAYDITALAAGTHKLTAKVRATSGSTTSTSATFTVGTATTTTTTSTTAPPSTTTTTAPPAVETVTAGARVPRFSPSSFWYQALPADVPLHPSSSALVATFDRQWKQYYGSVGINTTQYTPPVFVAAATTPLSVVRVWDCQNKGYIDKALGLQLSAVPVPADAAPSTGTDAELVISQPSTDTVWELWKARKALDGVWEACWGGKLTGVSTSYGLFPFPYGTTATGISLAGGLITPEELTAGRIDHALAVSMVEVRKTLFSWPAGRTDGSVDATDAIMEGQRFRLDPTLDVDALPITATAKIVARALQTYGMVVRDRSGSVTFYAENTAAEGRGDLYPAIFGTPGYKVLAGIPWTRLQALPTDFGK